MEEAAGKISLIERFLATNNNSKFNNNAMKKFAEIMENDLDTPKVLDFIVNLLENQENRETVKQLLEVLGFNFSS